MTTVSTADDRGARSARETAQACRTRQTQEQQQQAQRTQTPPPSDASQTQERTPRDPQVQESARRCASVAESSRCRDVATRCPTSTPLPQISSPLPQISSPVPRPADARPTSMPPVPRPADARPTSTPPVPRPADARPPTPMPAPTPATTFRPTSVGPGCTTPSTTPTQSPEPRPPAQNPAQPTQAPAAEPRTLRRGDRGEDVRELQRRLNANGARPPLQEDGRFGPLTQRALSQFQRQHGMRPDGSVGPRTREALGMDRASTTPPDRTPAPPDRTPRPPDRTPGGETRPNPGGNNTATFDRVETTGRAQRVSGRITVNGRTYEFTSGGSGRGSLPAGEYTVSNLRQRNTRGMVVGGVGFSADLSDKYDRRVGGTRTALRIHPDGGGRGTMGCIGIVGDAATQRRFYQDLQAELRRNGGRFTLRVG